MQQPVTYIIGHRNPDTDSICSALAYASLLRRQGREGVLAARAGNLNQQTEFVLETLKVETPKRLSDVYPRVGDVIGDQLVMLAPDEPVAVALELYNRHKIRTLPVVDADRVPLGLLLLKELTEHFLLPTRPGEMRRVHASVDSIVRCLHAQAVNLHEPKGVEALDLFVGARDNASFSTWIKGVDPRGTILITGQRPAIMRAAIEAGIRILILSGGGSFTPDLIELAQKHQVSLLSSHLDTANCCWLTRLATPVAEMVRADFLKVNRQELLSDLRIKLLHQDAVAAAVVDDDGTLAGIATKSHLLKSAPVRLILVDHNELGQAVPGADQVEILEVIDHHRLGNFHTDRPIRFLNQPVGSTCTLVAHQYRSAGFEPDKIIAGLLLAGLLSDTVILKSPTATDMDREICCWLSELSELDPESFGSQLFSAGSPMATAISAHKLITADFKEYEVGGKVLGLGQVEVVSFHTFYQRKEELSAELDKMRSDKSYHLVALLVTDIVEGTSLLLASGPEELPYLIGYPPQDKHLYLANGVLSRKKQLVPHLLKIFK